MKKKSINFILISLIILAYFWGASYQIRSPGLHDDEAIEFESAFNLFYKQQTLPLAICRFEGGMGAILMVPALYFYPEEPFVTLRYANIFYSLLTLIFIYCFSKHFVKNEFFSLLATLLVAAHPSFILSAKIGSQSCLNASLFAMASLYFFIKWLDTKKIAYFILLFICLGMGLDYRIHFLWFIVALVLSAFILLRQEVSKIISNRYGYYSFIAFLSFSTGALNFIWFNFRNNFILFKDLFYWTFISSSSTGDLMAGMAHYAKNFYLVTLNLVNILNGKFIFNYNDMGLGMFFYSRKITFLISTLFIFPIIYNLVSILKNDKHFLAPQKKLFLMLLVLIMLLQTPFTPSALPEWHLLLLLPLLIILFLVGLFELLYLFKGIKISKILAYSIILFILSINLVTINKFYGGLDSRGGNDRYSEAIYELNDWLLENNISQVIVNSGLQTLYVLSRARIQVDSLDGEIENLWITMKARDDFNPASIKEGYQTIFKKYFDSNDKPLIIAQYDYDEVNLLRFYNALNKSGKRTKKIKSFYRKDGRPIYDLVYLE